MADTDTTVTEEEESDGVPRRVVRVVRAVLSEIPATIIAIVVGALLGGFLGLAFLPFAPFAAVAGAVLLGLPVAVWEYTLQKRGESAAEYLD
jgi:uncharacterized membrane protein